ncbi:DUF6243 family protein [Streptomyces sp. SP18CS02]|uniref:DUF6243 family protein n=1 Tax=Streptomyces sp. SP18CS02 TaxID=3002531 RepID=UPI002E787BCD|nr:DUF6243 family protein [Streptomyces sp. SP18CS02]MEE1753400.1 DUF6243 family protein [Streptomyces sp. SP18CS02]
MAKSRNNLLGVGGQRKKVSRADQQGSAPARAADRRAASDQKQELLRRMRERAQGVAPGTDGDSAEQVQDQESAEQRG